MQPPICEICGERFSEGGDLLYFERTAKDEEWYVMAEQPGFVGHPPNAAWFCDKHLAAAKNLTHVHLTAAVTAIRKSLDEGKVGISLIEKLRNFISGEEEE